MTPPVSHTCEHVDRCNLGHYHACGLTAAWAYPAMGGGYCSLCPEHAIKHRAYCVTIEEAERGVQPQLLRSR